MLKGIRKFHKPAGEGGGSTVVEPARDLTKPEGLIGEVGEISGMYRDLTKRGGIVKNADGSFSIRDLDAVSKLERMEEDVLKRLLSLETAVKTSTSRLSGSDSDAQIIERAASILNVPEDMGGANRSFFNLIALKPEELTGMVEVGARRNVYGLAEMRGFAEAKNSDTVRNLRRLHALNDRYYLMYEWLWQGGRSEWAKSHHTSRLEGMRSLPGFDTFEKLATEHLRAMDETTANKGLSLVPIALSATFQEKMELSLRVASLFPQFPMPSKTYDWPVVSGHAAAYTTTEGTSDHATYQVGIVASNPLWALPRWTTQKLASLVFASSEITEDSVVPALPFLEDDIALALAHSLEEALVNGESGGATMDGTTFNPATESTTAPAAAGRRLLKGMRFYALMTASYPAAVDMGNVAITTAKAIDVQQAMNAWGVTPSSLAWISGYRAYHGLRKLPEMLTLDKLGPQAVLLTGQIGQFLGSPVVISEKLVDLNASGKYDGTTTNRGSLIAINTRRAALGTRRAVTVDMSEHVAFRNDQIAVRGTWRGDWEFIDTPAATVTPVGLLYNIA